MPKSINLFISTASTPSPPRIPWGGAGMLSPLQTNAKSLLPSPETRDTSVFSNIQSEDLAKELDTAEVMKAYSSQVYVVGHHNTVGTYLFSF